MAFKTLTTALGTVQPVPGAASSGIAQPLLNGQVPVDAVGSTDRFAAAQAVKQPPGSTRRAHANAPLSGRLPVQGARSQDRRPDANDGVPNTVENGVPVVHPGSTLR